MSENSLRDCDTAVPEEDRQEPDYRFTLANERTFLAWLRTGLALLAAAVAVVEYVSTISSSALSHVIGGMLAATALVVVLGGARRWCQVDSAIRAGRPLPVNRLPLVIAWVIGFLASS
ncbi:hypothetical protein GCM10027169_08660 [Gordonia jinhuaensis]|uniref:DUF202 domain-containing protein n=1 Tax=Gordonia jinhuaensis TaxID=1517702 RepID=A0A916TH06_9ACTN|nr:DUF202 domain-containing protein [Gordonia jinhuaensis]GGB44724.1 hypothetical protein GCM10011489_35210 [Gordonia jinhuaensis]